MTMLPALAGAGILLLGACADTGGGTAGDTDAPTAPDTTSSPSPTEDDDEDDDTVASGDAGCVEGEWDGDLEAIERQTLEALDVGEFQADPDVTVTGEHVIEFDGSTMTTEYDDQVTEVVLMVDGGGTEQEVLLTVRLDGTVEGTYTVDGDTMSVTDLDVSGLESEVRAEVAGQQYDLPGTDALDRDSYAVDQRFAFDCNDDELRLTPLADGDLEDLADDATSSPDPTESPDATGSETRLDELTQVLTRR